MRSSKSRIDQKKELDIHILDISNYEKISAFPKYKYATTILIIPNSAEDLRVCYNSIYYHQHKPGKYTQVRYLNLFQADDEIHREIKEMAENLRKTAPDTYVNAHELQKCKSLKVGEALDLAINHTLSVYKQILYANNEEKNNDTVNACDDSCCIL